MRSKSASLAKYGRVMCALSASRSLYRAAVAIAPALPAQLRRATPPMTSQLIALCMISSTRALPSSSRPKPPLIALPMPTPPPGYELAWKDDRLNPNRGKGTAEGWAAQDQVWTRKVPSRLVSDQAAAKGRKRRIQSIKVSIPGPPSVLRRAPRCARAGRESG